MVAVPTTSGTGSETTQFTIITNTETDVKMLLKGPVLMPDLAIDDPAFTMTAPPSITAATGLDALCHGAEAYTSRKAQAMTDDLAISAVKRIFKNQPVVYNEPKNVETRAEMSLAALEAGMDDIRPCNIVGAIHELPVYGAMRASHPTKKTTRLINQFSRVVFYL